MEASTQSSSPNADSQEQFPLLDLASLPIAIDPVHHPLLTALDTAVRTHMSTPLYDTSRNYQHAQRVVRHSLRFLAEERAQHAWARAVDPLVVLVGCLVQDMGDRKYRDTGDTREQQAIIEEFLAPFVCPDSLPDVAMLAVSVSFTLEKEDPAVVASVSERFPAFRFIQDADQNDGLGLVSTQRMLMYHDGHSTLKFEAIDAHVGFVEERFGKHVPFMKTRAGGGVRVDEDVGREVRGGVGVNNYLQTCWWYRRGRVKTRGQQKALYNTRTILCIHLSI